MINYTVLGPVTAWQDSWTASLLPQHQLLLAVLVIERGAPIQRQSLASVLWEDTEDPPERFLNRVVSELRTQLRVPQPATDPLPARGDTYSLPLAEQQADVLRFRSKIYQARRASGREATRFMQEALEEWGDNASGLFGGQPLAGLRGRWADSKRAELRSEYCDARYHCLKQEFDDHHYDRVVGECVQLANEPDALHEEKFVALWMIAEYRVGGRGEALKIYQRATESARSDLGLEPSGFLREIAKVIRTEDMSRIEGPDDLLGLAAATHTQSQPLEAGTGREADQAPGAGPGREPDAGSGGRPRIRPDRRIVKTKVDTIMADKVIFGFEASDHD